MDDALEGGVIVVVEAGLQREARAERRREQAAAGGGADEGERCNVESQRLRRATVANDDVNRAIFHCGIEHLFDRSAEAVDLVNEEHLSWREVGENRRHLSAVLDGWP